MCAGALDKHISIKSYQTYKGEVMIELDRGAVKALGK